MVVGTEFVLDEALLDDFARAEERHATQLGSWLSLLEPNQVLPGDPFELLAAASAH
jgi:hypothetical protein